MTSSRHSPPEGRRWSALWRIWRAPALRALLAQCLCFPLTLLVVYLLARAGLAPGYLVVALVQGAGAALVTWLLPLARWWVAIQLLFPLALFGASALALPPTLFLAGFLVLLLLFWSTFRTQVPYYPSGKGVCDAVAALLPHDRPARAIDIGSGFGGLVLDLAGRSPHWRVEGIEIAPLPWLASRLRARLAGSRAVFLRGDYEQLDFAAYDLVFAYLSPAAMEALWRKARREMRAGSRLVSYEFDIPGHPPDACQIPPPAARNLYVWNF